MDKVNQMLALFGHTMIPGSEAIVDPYEIMRTHSNIAVQILLKNREELHGIILGPIMSNGQIMDWFFVSSNNAKQYKQTKDNGLIQTIKHIEIERIENMP